MYGLRSMKMRVLHGIDPPLYVEFGVHEERPLVVIRWVSWLGGQDAG
jgi:hypothetical protein